MFESIRINGDFKLSSGKKSDYFYDLYLLQPNEILKYADKLSDDIDCKTYEYVATPAMGGIHIATMFAYCASKPLVIIGKGDEINGDRNLIGERYIIIDDVISTYQAVRRVMKILGEKDCVGAASFIFRGTEVDPHIPTYYLAKKEIEN